MLESYPSLTEKEFKLACASLEIRCGDRLSGTDWLGVEWTGQELRITQTRLDNGDDETKDIQPSVVENDQEEDEIDAEDEDMYSVRTGRLKCSLRRKLADTN